MTKIALGSDHAGFKLKTHVSEWLQQHGYEVKDCGVFDTNSADYPDIASAVAQEVAGGQADKGVLVCGSGVGVAIAANKIDGIRAVQGYDPVVAKLSRQHNDTNIITLGERLMTPLLAEKTLQSWLNTDFEGGRHSLRVDKISSLEGNQP